MVPSFFKNNSFYKGGIMKKVLGLIAAFMLFFSSVVYAGGDQNHGDKGQGPTGDGGKGPTTQTRGN
jgi:hypothetical protein